MSSGAHLDRPSRALRLYAVLFLVVLYVPILFLPLFSFNDSTYIAFPLKGFTLDWYAELMETPPMWDALWNSVKVGAAVSEIGRASCRERVYTKV